MASETAVSDHTSTTDESVLIHQLQEVEKKVINEEVKNLEEEKPKMEESPSPATVSSKPELQPEDKHIGPPLVKAEENYDDPAYIQEEKDFISHSHSPAVPEPVADRIETQSEQQPAIETLIKEAPKQVAIAFIEQGPEEKPKIVNVPELLAEAPEKLLETLDEHPAEESESVAIEERKDLDVKPEVAALEADEKLGEEQSELDEQVEIKESGKTDAEKDTRASVEKVEDTPLVKEVQTDEVLEEAGVLGKSEETLTNQEAQSDLKEDGIDFSLPVLVTEKVDAEDEKKLSVGDVAGEPLSEKAVVEIGNLSEENAARTGETEVVNEMKNEKSKASTLPVEVEDVDSFPSATEVVKKSIEGDQKVIEGNKGEQNVKDEILALTETNKDERMEEKQAEVTRIVSKTLKEDQEPELQSRSEKTVETNEDTLEKRKVDEFAKCDVQNLEPSIQESKLQLRSEETLETSDDKLEKGKADEIAKCGVKNLEPSVQESELQVRSEESVETSENKLEKGKVDEIAKADVQNLVPSVQEPELQVRNEEESVETVGDKLEKGKVDEIANANVQNLELSVQEPELQVRNEEESVETVGDKLEKGKVDEIANANVQNLELSVQEPELQVRNGEESVETGEDKLEKGKVEEIAEADVQNLEPTVQEFELQVRSEEESVETGADKLEKGKVDEIAKANVQNLEPSTLESELQVRSEETLETGEEKREKGEVGEIAKADVQNAEPSVQESELQARREETVETGEDKLEKGNAGEVAKSDVQNLEPTINTGNETKTSQVHTKDHPTKSTPKQSNNIISKVKQSLVKAKKAIIGKSPNSKTISSDTKDDIKVK